jgi:hypothetical protein
MAEFRDIFISLLDSPVVVSVVFSCIWMRLFVCSSASFPPEVAASIAWGLQQNRLKAPGRSVAPDVNVPVQMAAQTPEAICTSRCFECRKYCACDSAWMRRSTGPGLQRTSWSVWSAPSRRAWAPTRIVLTVGLSEGRSQTEIFLVYLKGFNRSLVRCCSSTQ